MSVNAPVTSIQLPPNRSPKNTFATTIVSTMPTTDIR
jgi:hypothetical protein